jgi:NAD(P)H-hydrate epimerase
MEPPPAETAITEVPHLPPRPADANKGNFGRALVVAGSRGMSGAAVLCGSAALRGGAGLVRLAIPQGLLPLVAPANPCYMTAPLPENSAGRLSAAARDELLDCLRWASAAAVGPGLGRSPDLDALLHDVVAGTETPLVLDADALNGLAGQVSVLRAHPGPLVLTPHPGVFGRLAGLDIPAVQADRRGHALRFAAAHGVVLVLKGHGTVVTDGRRLYVNSTGNPGLATGGTGDVLAGLTAALLAQGLETFAAAQLAVYLHGLAGDLARDDLGESSLIASDLLEYLPRAFVAHARSRPGAGSGAANPRGSKS